MDPYGDPVVPLTVRFALLTVSGPGAARGRVTLSGNRLTGTLARRAVDVALLAGRGGAPVSDPPPAQGGGRDASARARRGYNAGAPISVVS